MKRVSVLRFHLGRLLGKPSNGHEAMKQADELLLKIRNSRRRLFASVEAIAAINGK